MYIANILINPREINCFLRRVHIYLSKALVRHLNNMVKQIKVVEVIGFPNSFLSSFFGFAIRIYNKKK